MTGLRKQYVVQRAEDRKFLGNNERPAADSRDAQTFDSLAIAKIQSDRAAKIYRGSWSAVPAPADPDDDERLAAQPATCNKF